MEIDVKQSKDHACLQLLFCSLKDNPNGNYASTNTVDYTVTMPVSASLKLFRIQKKKIQHINTSIPNQLNYKRKLSQVFSTTEAVYKQSTTHINKLNKARSLKDSSYQLDR